MENQNNNGKNDKRLFSFFKIDEKTGQSSRLPFLSIRAGSLDLEVGVIIETSASKDGTLCHYLIERLEETAEKVDVYLSLHKSISLTGVLK